MSLASDHREQQREALRKLFKDCDWADDEALDEIIDAVEMVE